MWQAPCEHVAKGQLHSTHDGIRGFPWKFSRNYGRGSVNRISGGVDSVWVTSENKDRLGLCLQLDKSDRSSSAESRYAESLVLWDAEVLETEEI